MKKFYYLGADVLDITQVDATQNEEIRLINNIKVLSCLFAFPMHIVLTLIGSITVLLAYNIFTKLIIPCLIGIIYGFLSIQNSPKNLDLSYKTELFWNGKPHFLVELHKTTF